ncbi:GNAT family N-acetyltransferase [Avibacterium sp. 21-595]|uniref:GNAT family N-acetyltransferase n=1 Tax=Avibacterium sp. 21-595 TaxID=2911527 RepID=UPI0020274B3A|nr:GNAT family N-acetyltransferase [Avibacterium sp. 21-595]URL05614.1 GNAT family N-acetyltransferase [Avibacterium sp. 21-595]
MRVQIELEHIDIVTLSQLKLDRKSFCSLSPELNRYFYTQASQDERKELSKCFVLIHQKQAKIIGYYTLSATAINVSDIPKTQIKQEIRYPNIPAALIGRLAVDEQFVGCDYGKFLIADAISKIKESKLAVAVLLVQAKDEQATAFYHKLGFITFLERKNMLFLPLTKLIKK